MLVSGVDEPRGPRSSSWTPTTRGPFRGARRTRSKGVVGKAELLLVLDQPNFGNKGGFSRAPVPTPFLPRTAYSTGQTHVRGGRLARSHPRETTAESFNVNKPLFDSISDADLVLNSTVTNGTSVGGGQLPGYDTPHLPGPPLAWPGACSGARPGRKRHLQQGTLDCVSCEQDHLRAVHDPRARGASGVALASRGEHRHPSPYNPLPRSLFSLVPARWSRTELGAELMPPTHTGTASPRNGSSPTAARPARPASRAPPARRSFDFLVRNTAVSQDTSGRAAP